MGVDDIKKKAKTISKDKILKAISKETEGIQQKLSLAKDFTTKLSASESKSTSFENRVVWIVSLTKT